MITGEMAWTALWIWIGIVLLHALYRAFARPEPNAIRASGPIGFDD